MVGKVSSNRHHPPVALKRKARSRGHVRHLASYLAHLALLQVLSQLSRCRRAVSRRHHILLSHKV